jgi:hypothetical protein
VIGRWPHAVENSSLVRAVFTRERISLFSFASQGRFFWTLRNKCLSFVKPLYTGHLVDPNVVSGSVFVGPCIWKSDTLEDFSSRHLLSVSAAAVHLWNLCFARRLWRLLNRWDLKDLNTIQSRLFTCESGRIWWIPVKEMPSEYLSWSYVGRLMQAYRCDLRPSIITDKIGNSLSVLITFEVLTAVKMSMLVFL